MNVFSITKKKDFNFLMDSYSDNPFIRISPMEEKLKSLFSVSIVYSDKPFMEEKLKSLFSVSIVYSDKPYGGKIEIPFFGFDRLFG